MSRSVNLLRDANLSRAARYHHAWTGRGPAGALRPGPDGFQFTSSEPVACAALAQHIHAKGGKHYRVEVFVECRTHPRADTVSDARGFVLEVWPRANGRLVRGCGWRRVLTRSDRAVLLGGYVRLPESADGLRISFGLMNASGTARVQLARVLRILAPEAESHPLAVPPPVSVYSAPRRTHSVAVISERDTGLAQVIGQNLEIGEVRTWRARDWHADIPAVDTLIIRGDVPPSALDSMRTLLEWGRQGLVIVSLPIFARLAGKALTLRRVEQEDDPIHARVAHANFITSGFALWDVFPFAWSGRAPGWQVQRQYKLGQRFKAFCRRHGWITVLESMCDADATSGRPICLYKQLDGGGVIALDLEPLDQPMPGVGQEDALALHLLANICGLSPASIGQFTVPASDEEAFRRDVAELAVRFDGVRVETQPGGQQLVMAGEWKPSGDMRRAILVRSGFRGDDFEAIYGCLQFIKQLVRPPPHTWRSAVELFADFRVLWSPLHADCDWHWGFSRVHERPKHAKGAGASGDVGLSERRVATLIDVVTSRRPDARIIVSAAGHLASPALAALVTVDPLAFDSRLRSRAAQAGTTLIRLEVPGDCATFIANSIQRTGLVAALLGELFALHRRGGNFARSGQPPMAPRDVLPNAAARAGRLAATPPHRSFLE
ncbi:MAG TPA: hypothetical protein VGM03_22645 [Phycisphaerae bacterium]